MEYKRLVEVYEKLGNTSKRLEKTSIISELLKKTLVYDLKEVILLLQGRVFPRWDEKKIGVAARLILRSINIATGISIDKVEEEWKNTGDLGLTAEKLINKKQQATLFSQDLESGKVFQNIKALASAEGHGAVDRKIKLIAELLTSADPLEARYIVRTVLEELRVGVGEGSLRDAIVWAFFGDRINIRYNPEKNDIELDEEERKNYVLYVDFVQEAYDIANDFSEVAEVAKTEGLEGLNNIRLEPGKPIKVMLYPKAENVEDGFDRCNKPAACELKYDGFRLQIHKNNNDIKLFTRRLEDVTRQFPDVIEIVKQGIKADRYIIDTEAIGIDPKTKRHIPFQNISQRIKRKYDIHKLAKEVPVIVNVFDIMLLENENTIKKPFSERRALIKSIVEEIPDKLCLAEQLITDDMQKAEEFYQYALSGGYEGVMMKALDKPYTPGKRVGSGVKIKPVMETVDLVIVGAEWGEGKRANWLSSFDIACVDEDGSLLEVGKVSTGFKEVSEEGTSFDQITEMLRPLIISEKGKHVKVKPRIIIEVSYEEIQKSPTYNSGFALRFPRLVRLRDDRGIEDASTIEMVKEFYENQKR